MKLQEWANAVGGKPQHWLFYYDYIFRDISFAGKTVLDIGGGVGRSAYYAAAAGASRVVCIEPEAEGSHNNMLATAAAIGDKLGLRDKVEFITKPVQEVDFKEQFDIVMMLNSINHLEEEACISLRHDPRSRSKYASVFHQISDMTKLGGDILITDCSNENLSHAIVGSLEKTYRRVFRIRERLGWYFNPFATNVEFWKHQTPELWAQLLHNAGFRDPIIRWTPDRRSGKFGEKFLTSKLASYCLQSHFCLTMKKQVNSPGVEAKDPMEKWGEPYQR